jgi:amidase
VKRFSSNDLKFEYSYLHDPVGRVAPGEVFEVETEDCFSGRFREPKGFTRENVEFVTRNLNGVTGPIYVEGAEPGDVLAVTLEAIEPMTPGSVVLSRYSYPSPEDWWDEEVSCKSYELQTGWLQFSAGLKVKINPMIGCLATAPDREVVLSKREGTYGGNMDCREIGAGATVSLPVFVEGAYLYFGDCKAIMGDGEIVQPPEIGTLIRTVVTLRQRPPHMMWPRVETSNSLISVVSDRSLEVACRAAFREVLSWLEYEYKLTREDAAMLMGMVAHVGVCQISNSLCTAKCTMPTDVLSQSFVE